MCVKSLLLKIECTAVHVGRGGRSLRMLKSSALAAAAAAVVVSAEVALPPPTTT